LDFAKKTLKTYSRNRLRTNAYDS